ncbi:MAG: hypothetical protein KDD67_13755 [Ignavibacteriae bacterium]|nr:hypothetical protein [Ignavibacteriota bacterium]MCB9216148.1 hypothetical protein [Ignavibacteria bacterium]
MKQVFEQGDQKFVYDYTKLKAERIAIARRIAELHSERARNPPRSINELKMSGDHLWEAEMFSYLLTELDDDGMPVKWNPHNSPDKALAFYKDLDGIYTDALELCKSDFFVRARIVRPDALERLARIIAATQAESSESEMSEQTSGKSSSEQPTDENDSTESLS